MVKRRSHEKCHIIKLDEENLYGIGFVLTID